MKKGWSSFMDRRVKERLVGASILVVLIVLIVPELLSGPKHAALPRPPSGTEPVRSVVVDLATNKTTPGLDDNAASAATSDAPASGAPAPAASPSDVASPDASASDAATSDTHTGDVEAQPRAVATPPVITTLQAQPAPTGLVRHGWTAQLGSFASRGNAEKLERQLRTQGFSASVSAAGTGAALRYRVRVGAVMDRATADRMVAKLKKAGHSARSVAT